MEKKEIKTIASNILTADRYVEYIKGLLESDGYNIEITQAEYICEEYMTLNQIEKELGLSLTPINGEKDLKKLKEEVKKFTKAHSTDAELMTTIENYIGLVSWFTINKFSSIKSELESKNENFTQLLSAIMKRRALRESLKDLSKEEMAEVINEYGIAAANKEQQPKKR